MAVTVNNSHLQQPMGCTGQHAASSQDGVAALYLSPSNAEGMNMICNEESAVFPVVTEAEELLFLSLTPEGNFLCLINPQTQHTISIPFNNKVLSLVQRFDYVFVLAEHEAVSRCYRYNMDLRVCKEIFTVPMEESNNITMAVNGNRTLTTMHHSGLDAVLTTYNWDGVQTSQLRLDLIASPGIWSLDGDNVLFSRFTQQCTLYRCDTVDGAPSQLYNGAALRCVTTDDAGVIYGLECTNRSQLRVLVIHPQDGVIKVLPVPAVAPECRRWIALRNTQFRLVVRGALIAFQCLVKSSRHGILKLYRTII